MPRLPELRRPVVLVRDWIEGVEELPGWCEEKCSAGCAVLCCRDGTLGSGG